MKGVCSLLLHVFLGANESLDNFVLLFNIQFSAPVYIKEYWLGKHIFYQVYSAYECLSAVPAYAQNI